MYKLGLKVLGLVLLLSLSPAAQAQSIWDNEEDEQTVNPGEFELNSGEDGINIYNGSSIYGNNIGGNSYQYHYKQSNSDLGYDINGTATVRELDIDVHKNQGAGNSSYGGGAGGGGNSNNTNNSPSGADNGLGYSGGGQIKNNPFETAAGAGNPGDPIDSPIDGGLSILVGAGVAFGAKKIREKSKKAKV